MISMQMKLSAFPWLKTGVAAVAVMLPALSSCGAKNLASAVRPDAPEATEELRPSTGEEPECTSVPAYAAPLVVDWPSEKRGDLEVAMAQGIVPVTYDCKTLKIARGCSAQGRYGFMGISLKKETLSLKTADELKANLPVGGVELGGGFESGVSLDVAMAMVGVSATTKRKVARGQLDGDCDGVTHFVKSATLGAFKVSKGSKAKLEASVKALGAGVEGKSSSEKKSLTADGEMGACSSWSPDKEEAPGKCRALVRLQLEPVVEGDGPEDEGGDSALIGEIRGSRCPEGMAFKDGKCEATTTRGQMCTPTDAEDCERQCKLGHIGSCTALGRIRASGIGVPKRPAEALEPLQTACEAEMPDPKACLLLATILRKGPKGVNRDEQKSRRMARRASWILQKECDEQDNAESCGLVGALFGSGDLLDADPGAAQPLLEKACNGGWAESCTILAKPVYTEDQEKQLALKKRSCNGGHGIGCFQASKVLEKSVEDDKPFPEGVLDLRRRACDADHAISCAVLGIWQFAGARGIPEDKKAAEGLWAHYRKLEKKRCEGGNFEACNDLAEIFAEDLPGSPKDASLVSWANKQWLSIKERECTVNLDGESCIELHNAHMSGRRGLTRNESRARGFYDQWRRMRARECSPTSPGLCLQLSRYMLRGIGYFNATQLRSYLETACAGGRSGADGCWILAQQYLPGGKFRNDPIAAELWSRRACEGGVRDGCVALGDQYRDGVGVAKDLKKAFALYEHTCSASRRTHRNACSRFEEMLYKGKGTKRDRSRFFSEVQTRCYDTGASDACITLAITYRRGIGTKMDRKKSKALIERACSSQRPWGCAVYGEFLEKGKYARRRRSAALKAYRQACDSWRALDDSCAAAGRLYQTYAGGTPNRKEARKVLERGCAKHAKGESCTELTKLNEKDKKKGKLAQK